MNLKTNNTHPFHFFGSTALGWATGTTRAEVLAKLGRLAGADMIKRQVKANGGLYAWVCRVELPADAEYDIEFYGPKNVPTKNPREYNIQNIKGHALPIDEKEPSA